MVGSLEGTGRSAPWTPGTQVFPPRGPCTDPRALAAWKDVAGPTDPAPRLEDVAAPRGAGQGAVITGDPWLPDDPGALYPAGRCRHHMMMGPARGRGVLSVHPGAPFLGDVGAVGSHPRCLGPAGSHRSAPGRSPGKCRELAGRRGTRAPAPAERSPTDADVLSCDSQRPPPCHPHSCCVLTAPLRADGGQWPLCPPTSDPGGQLSAHPAPEAEAGRLLTPILMR